MLLCEKLFLYRTPKNIVLYLTQLLATQINLLITHGGCCICVCLTCICARFPAVMFEMVQQASLRIDSLALLRRCSRQGRAEQFNTTYTTATHWIRTLKSMLCPTMI